MYIKHKIPINQFDKFVIYIILALFLIININSSDNKLEFLISSV